MRAATAQRVEKSPAPSVPVRRGHLRLVTGGLAATAAPAPASTTFGLRRDFRLWHTYVFDTIGFAPGLVMAAFPAFAAAFFPGCNLFLVLALGTALTLANGVVFGALAGVMPRSGGEYVYNSRLLHPAVGFVTNWGFTWSQLLGLAIYSQWCVAKALPTAVATVAWSLGAEAPAGLVARLSSPGATFAAAALVMASVFAVHAAGVRILRVVLTAGFACIAAGLLATLAVLVGSDREGFAAAVDAFLRESRGVADGYAWTLATARAAGWRGHEAGAGDYLAALAMVYWMFIGFTYSVYVGGEVERPARTQLRAVLGALATGFAVYTATLGAYYHVVGREFSEAAAYLERHGVAVFPVPLGVNSVAGLLAERPWLSAVVGLSYTLSHYLLLLVIFTFVVRQVFAWGQDRVVPGRLAGVTRRARTPWAAGVTTLGLTLFLLALVCFTRLFTDVLDYIVLFSVSFWVTSFAAMLIPARQPEALAGVAGWLVRRVAGLPLLTVAGLVNLALFSAILYASLAVPQLNSPRSHWADGFTAAVYAGGVIVYLAARRYHCRHGRDLRLLFTKLPPG